MYDTANWIKNEQLTLQHTFEIQKGYHNQRHGQLPVYAAGNYATVRLKLHPIVALPTYKLGPQRSRPFKILRTLSGDHTVELRSPKH